MKELHKVRTTIEPGREIEVTDAELADLRGQGLLVEGKNITEVRRNARDLQTEKG